MCLRHVAILLTTHCNLRCAYCLLQPPRRETASWPVLRSALDRLLADGQDDVTVLFTGGEPLLALPLMRQAVAHLLETQAGRRSLRWEVITNGLLLNEEAVDFLDAHDFAVTVSFDGVREAQAERRRGSFDRLDDLLIRLRRSRPAFFERLTVAMTISPATVPYFARSVAYFVASGIRHLTYKPSVPGSDWEPARIRELEVQWSALTAAVRAHAERTGREAISLFGDGLEPARTDRGDWICSVADGDSVTIDVDGRAYGCVVAAGSYQAATAPVLRDAVDALALGPADASTFDAALASLRERARACGAYTHPEQRYSSYRRCADCEFLGRCSACPLAAASDLGWPDPRRVPDFVCAWNQAWLAHADRFAGPTPGNDARTP
jgi:sulfatase maturation enzyme AslB (radical SAM superfamily)